MRRVLLVAVLGIAYFCSLPAFIRQDLLSSAVFSWEKGPQVVSRIAGKPGLPEAQVCLFRARTSDTQKEVVQLPHLWMWQ